MCGDFMRGESVENVELISRRIRGEYMCGKKQMIILGQVFGAALVSLGRLGIPSRRLAHIQVIHGLFILKQKVLLWYHRIPFFLYF
jgi:hypothetical protein